MKQFITKESNGVNENDKNPFRRPFGKKFDQGQEMGQPIIIENMDDLKNLVSIESTGMDGTEKKSFKID